MNFYLIFVLVSLFLFCKFGGLHGVDLKPDQVAELQVLKELTEKLEKANQSLDIPRDILQYEDYDISFYVYTQSSPSGTLLLYNQSDLLSSVDGFNTNLNTVFLIHGWIDNYLSAMNNALRNVLLANTAVNVISVDWSTYARLIYSSSVAAVPNVGETLAKFIQDVLTDYSYSADQIILVGYSLGAHIAGFGGKALNGTVGVIIGMDPAGPLYFQSSSSTRLSSGDAQYVQAIHTNALFLGVTFDLADADFWPNGGYTQPGCIDIYFNSCSHDRSYILMAESIVNNQFYARECESYLNYLNGNCADNTLALMGGLVFDTSATGVFYLNTSSSSPYGLGNIYSGVFDYFH